MARNEVGDFIKILVFLIIVAITVISSIVKAIRQKRGQKEGGVDDGRKFLAPRPEDADKDEEEVVYVGDANEIEQFFEKLRSGGQPPKPAPPQPKPRVMMELPRLTPAEAEREAKRASWDDDLPENRHYDQAHREKVTNIGHLGHDHLAKLVGISDDKRLGGFIVEKLDGLGKDRPQAAAAKPAVIAGLFATKDDQKRAIILYEIIGPPRAERPY